MEKIVEYNETAAQHIYTYHNTSRKGNIERYEKVKVSVEEATHCQRAEKSYQTSCRSLLRCRYGI